MSDSILTIYKNDLYGKLDRDVINLILNYIDSDEFVLIEDTEDSYDYLLKTLSVSSKDLIEDKQINNTQLKIFKYKKTKYICIGKDSLGTFIIYGI